MVGVGIDVAVRVALGSRVPVTVAARAAVPVARGVPPETGTPRIAASGPSWLPLGGAVLMPGVGEAEGGGAASSGRAAASPIGVTAAARTGCIVACSASSAVCVDTLAAKRGKKSSGVAVGSSAQPAPQRAAGVATRPSCETTTIDPRARDAAATGEGGAGGLAQPATRSRASPTSVILCIRVAASVGEGSAPEHRGYP